MNLPFDGEPETDEFQMRVILKKEANYNITVRQIDCPDSEPRQDAPYTQFEDFALVMARLGEQKIGDSNDIFNKF